MVQHGKQSATIRIKLQNTGSESFKHDIYGDSIIVERRILREGGGSYTLKDSQGKKQSSSRAELESMMEQLNIQVDNPCNILMQDASKLFLASNKPEKKYELFLKATQLEQMRDDLTEAATNLQLGGDALRTKQESVGEMEKKVNALEEKVRALEALDKDRKQVKQMRVNMAWAHVQRKETALEQVLADIAKKEEQHTKVEQAKAGKDDAIRSMREEQTQLEVRTQDLRDRTTQVATNLRTYNEQLRAIRLEAGTFDIEIETKRADQSRAQKRKDVVRAEIQKLRAKGRGGDQDAVYRRKLEQAAKSREKVERLQAELKEVEQKQPELQAELTQVQAGLQEATAQFQGLEGEVSRLALDVKRLEAATKDRSATFGADVPRLRKVIQDNIKRFSEPPIGPIGVYITMKEERWAWAVEYAVDKTLEKFIVNNSEDMRLLQRLAKDNKLHVPQIAIFPFAQPAYQISANRLPGSQFKTLLSTVQITNHVAFNVLIDDCNLESRVLFETDKECREVMFADMDQRTGKTFAPRNVMEGLSMEPHTYAIVLHGAQVTQGLKSEKTGRLVADVTESLRTTKRRLDERNALLQPIRVQMQSLKDRDGVLQRELRRAGERIVHIPGAMDQLNREIEELERPPEVEPDKAAEIAALEARFAPLDQTIEEEAAKIEEIEEAKREFLKGLEPIEAQKREVSVQADELDVQFQEAVKQLDQLTRAITVQLGKLPQFEAALTKLKTELVTFREEEQSAVRQVEEYTTKASTLGERPAEEIKQSPEEIEKRIKGVEKMIQDRECQGGLDRSVLAQYADARKTLDELKQAIEETAQALEHGKHMLKVRGKRWRVFRKALSHRARMLFVSHLTYRNFDGQLVFDHDNGALNIEINPNRNATGGTRDTMTLSGGERSYSTVCLLLALWDTMESPFRAMDEFDVFMDAVNRHMSMELLLNAATGRASNRQHIFLTPQQLQGVKPSPLVKILRMTPPQRGQRTIEEVLNGGDEE